MSEKDDRAALLDQLKIDRTVEPTDMGRPVKWFIGIAVLAGAAFTYFLFRAPAASDDLVDVSTAVARSASERAAGSVLDATGYVVARRQATVSSKATGKVVEVLIEEGMVVAEGQLLARLDDSIPRAQLKLAESQVAAAEASIAELEVSIKQAELDLERTQGLAQRNLASAADLDRDELAVDGLIARLERARSDITVAESSLAVQRQVLDDMMIRSPFDGIVITKAAQPGEMISPISAGGGFTRTGICTIVDMDSLEIEVDVNESYINRVRANQPVEVRLNAYPDDAYPASVIAIVPAADRNKATVRVRVRLLKSDARVLPDMGVRVAFLGGASADVEVPAGVLVPQTALAEHTDGDFVFVVRGSSVERRPVVAGGASGGNARIIEGLDQGERVVTNLTDELVATLEGGAEIDTGGRTDG